jgi:hypothetical protein
MTIDEALADITTTETSVTLNAASGTTGFYRAVSRRESFKSLVTQLTNPATAKAAAGAISRTLGRFVSTSVDLAFEHPYDAAMAICLMALAQSGNADLTRIAAAEVLRAQNTWWAARVARDVLGQRKSDAETVTVVGAVAPQLLQLGAELQATGSWTVGPQAYLGPALLGTIIGAIGHSLGSGSFQRLSSDRGPTIETAANRIETETQND